MTLTARLGSLALASLACVLAGFSATLYLAAREHLHRRAEERLDAALNTLAAAAEAGPGGVEWEPGGRDLAVGPRAGADLVAWTVTGPAGRVVAASPGAASADLLAEAAGRAGAAAGAETRVSWRGGRWRAAQRRVGPADGGAEPAPPRPEARAERYDYLVVTAAVPLEPDRSALRQLAAALAGTSAGVLAAGASAGRAVCRRALRPVRAMAAAARRMDPADPALRLRPAATGDELEDLGRAFDGLLDRLHAALERQRRFAGEVSHQLRTPLTAILGHAEVALRRDRSPAEYRAALAAVRAQAGHLQRIVEALLVLARADADAQAPGRERVELGGWVAGRLAGWAGHPRGADIRLEPAAGPVEAAAHPVMLGEALDILLDNACKYSDPGTPVTVRVRAAAGRAELAVEDRGCGVAADELPHLFRPFFRSRSARARGAEGTGLGLSIARRLMAAQGGEVDAASGPDGSTFTLRLPAVPNSPERPIARSATGP